MTPGTSKPGGRSEQLVEMAHEVGFDLAAVTPLEPPPDAARFEAWLAKGYGADMEWLVRQKGRIMDPRGLSGQPASLLVVGLAHSRPALSLTGGGRIARYALGRDYHNRIGKLLKRLRRRIEAAGMPLAGRALCDAAPLLERSHAAAAGLGFASKAANLLHPRFGPWFFLGELVIEADLAPTNTPPNGSCGTCTACLDACPTQAIRAPGVVDATLCISYHTIENRGAIPEPLRAAVGDWAFGCDICSEVCPWGHKAPDTSSDWGTHSGLDGDLLSWLRVGEASFKERWQGSAMQRPKRAGLARNAALVLGMHPVEGGRECLTCLLDSEREVWVREAAAWGLARGYGRDAGVRQALEAAAAREVDPVWRARFVRDLELSAI